MTYKDLIEELQALSPEQLLQPAHVLAGEDENARPVDSLDISDEDVYWEHHGDCIGNLEQVKETFGEDWEHEIEDLIQVPAGTVLIDASY